MTTSFDTAITGSDSTADSALLRTPPHSLEAEQAVIGGLLIDHQSFDQVLEVLQARDFYNPDNRLIFTTMMRLSENSKPLDIVTVSELLDQSGELSKVGGIAHLAELARHTPGTANLLTYANVVRERSVLRQLIRTAHTIADRGYTPDGRDSGDILAEAEKSIADLAEQRPNEGGFTTANVLLSDALQRISELSQSDSAITGLDTGFYKLNEMTAGLQPADLIILAARPSMGKTALAVNLAENILLRQEKPVLIFSLEMPARSIIFRMLSSVGRINQGHMLNGKLELDEWEKLSAAMVKIQDRPLFIDDTPAISPAEMRARIRKLERDHGQIGLVVVDYLQLMRAPSASEGRTAEVSEISRSLKAIAKEFNCPLIALSQLNRAVESRPNKRPTNADLRDSGAIEQDADLIMFIYRDEKYNPDSPDKGTAEIIIGKHRNGPIGDFKLAFQDRFTRFDNLASSSDSANKY